MIQNAAITTSWDDGHPLDLKLAGLLAKHNMKGTFYVPTRHSEWPLMKSSQIVELDRMGMEIGSHTVNHAVLPELSEADARRELVESRKTLEDLLGKPVPAFCFPKGRFNARTCALARESGYELARTTVGFRTEADFDPACMPVSVQFVPHTRRIHVRHALKEGNAKGLLNWFRNCKLVTGLDALSAMMMNQAVAGCGVFHLWGHSWEVDQLDLWDQLEDVLKAASSMRLEARTNSQVI